ncbi:MAG TPA: hypothetical protein VG269_21805, partial [Tepidisphaeraceae bacterium]|nr:hypothetical protein [Tepidisphaeraceae bacterium]
MRAAVVMMVFLALATARATAGQGFPVDGQSVMIRVTFYNGTSITCRAVDERRSASGRPYRMRDVQAVFLPPHQTGTVRLNTGEVMSLPEAGFDRVEAWLGSQRLELECLNVTSFQVLDGAQGPRGGRPDQPPAPPVTVVRPADNYAGARTLRLPTAADEVVAAGNGRYLLLYMKQLRKLAVFDARTGSLTKFLPVGSESAYVAGGATKFIVVLPDQNIIQRWDLASFERELSLPLPEGDTVDGAVMGYASAGPLLLMRRDGPQFLDIRTLKSLALALPASAGNWRPHPQYPLAVRASADGSTFAAWEPGLSPAGIRTLSIHGATISARYEHTSAGELLPAVDGASLFT